MMIPVEYELAPAIQNLIEKFNEHVCKGMFLLEEGKYEESHFQFLEAKKISVELELVHGVTITFKEDI